ncbi:hypothetical protein [Brumicola blandensis]|uniref:Alpha/beta hydrolase n=1 Tax=Brumicola blandensis TaxID=3075611 RepID=A0AAW8R3A2_9ALTE|nr:hypothetical protein [Alteromonas sp. W409]MDT0583385.1 hypothetical protein [Alteromonas sp. W409]
MKAHSKSIGKYSGLLFVMFCLTACHSIIASQITKPLTPVFSKLSEEETRFFGEFFRYCDSNKKCLDLFLRQAQEVDTERTIKLSLIQGTEKKVFNVDLNETNRYSSEPGKLIVIFPGFGIDSRVYSGTLAPWLNHLSGNDVLVAPAANQNANFNFGLDSASLIAEYIKKSAYKKVSVLSFSMGAVAAIHLASLTEVERNVMIAPMQDFPLALKTVGGMQYPKLSKFLNDDDYISIANEVILNSKVDANTLDLRSRLQQYQVQDTRRVHLFASRGDRISPFQYWKPLAETSVCLKQTNKLNHTHLMALMDEDLRNEVLLLMRAPLRRNECIAESDVAI